MDEITPSTGAIAFWARHGAAGWPRRAALALVNAVLPPRCAACRAVTASDAGFCPDCWSKLDFLVGPACARCDLPFDAPQGDGALCGACMASPPPYVRVHAPLAYGDVSRSIVMRLKYGRRTGFARLMARLIARILPASAPPPDQMPTSGADLPPLIVPVPLHRWRIWTRGFNQSAEVGRHLSLLTGWPVAVDALHRHRRTPPLRGLGRAARARTVRGAFTVLPQHKPAVAGRRILLVDDVFTTGATASACARVLLRAGAAQVEVAAFARVLNRPDAMADLGSDRGAVIDSG